MNTLENHENSSFSNINLMETLLCVLFIVLPLFFLSFTFDIFTLNKTYLIAFFSLVSLILFLLVGLKKNQLSLLNAKAYLPFFVFLTILAGATYFAVNRNVAIFGQSENYNFSLIYFLSFAILSFVYTNVRFNLTKVLGYSFLGITFATFFSWAALYNVTIPFLGQLVPGSSLEQSFDGLMGLQVLASVYTFYYLLTTEKAKISKKLVSLLIFVVNTAFIVIIANPYILGLWLVGMFYVLYNNTDKFLKYNKILIVTGFILSILIAVVHFIPQYVKVTNLDREVKVAKLNVKDSWIIATQVMQAYPAWGTGLGSYPLDYNRFKPVTSNYTSTWEVTYRYPANDVFLWLTTAGLIGFAGYVFILVIGILASLRALKNNNFVLGSMFLGVLAVQLFMGYSDTLYLLFFILLAKLISTKESINFYQLRSKNVITGLFLLSLVLLGLFFYKAYQVYAGQVNFKKAMLSTEFEPRFTLLDNTIKFDLYESAYRRRLVLDSIALASGLSNKENLTEEEKQSIVNILTNAVTQARLLTEVVDPLSSENWEVRAIVYRTMIGLDKENQFTQLALSSYKNAIQLDPNNPRYYVEIGGIYSRNKDINQAVNFYSNAIQLKNDYINAYYNLAYALKEGGAMPQALVQMEVVNRLLPANSPAKEKAQKELEEFKKLADEYNEKVKQSEAAKVNTEKVPTVDLNKVKNTVDKNTQLQKAGEESNSLDINKSSNVDVSKIKDEVKDPSEPTAEEKLKGNN